MKIDASGEASVMLRVMLIVKGPPVPVLTMSITALSDMASVRDGRYPRREQNPILGLPYPLEGYPRA
jgi:hypothetical protein